MKRLKLFEPVRKVIVVNYIISTSGLQFDTAAQVIDLSKEVGRCKIKSFYSTRSRQSSAILRAPTVATYLRPTTANQSIGDLVGAMYGSEIPISENQIKLEDGLTVNGGGDLSIGWELIWSIAPAAGEDVNVGAVIELEFY